MFYRLLVTLCGQALRALALTCDAMTCAQFGRDEIFSLLFTVCLTLAAPSHRKLRDVRSFFLATSVLAIEIQDMYLARSFDMVLLQLFANQFCYVIVERRNPSWGESSRHGKIQMA